MTVWCNIPNTYTKLCMSVAETTSVGVLTSSGGTLGLISVSPCWIMWKSLDDDVCVCTKIVCSHPPVQVYFIDSHASMLPVFVDSACICVCSTYGVHSLGKAFISSWVYSLSFLGISRGWGSSSVRFARMSSGSSWGAVGVCVCVGGEQRKREIKELILLSSHCNSDLFHNWKHHCELKQANVKNYHSEKLSDFSSLTLFIH